MIRYSLNCHKGHEFEVWFRSSADYDDQKAHGTVNCPVCGSAEVEKAIMAPSISAGIATSGQAEAPQGDGAQPETPCQVPQGDAPSLNLPDPSLMVEAVREYHNYVKSNADNVGDKFAEEARKIHFNEVPARGIYGKATLDEASELHEEGIEIAPLPILPEEHN